MAAVLHNPNPQQNLKFSVWSAVSRGCCCKSIGKKTAVHRKHKGGQNTDWNDQPIADLYPQPTSSESDCKDLDITRRFVSSVVISSYTFNMDT